MSRLSCWSFLWLGLAGLAATMFYTYFIKHQPHAPLLYTITHRDNEGFHSQLFALLAQEQHTPSTLKQELITDINDISFGDGRSVAHAVAMHGSLSMLDTIHDLGANLQQHRIQDGRTPLHIAAMYNSYPFVERLIEYGATVNARAHNDWIPLHYSILFSQHNNTRVLLQHGADVQARLSNKGYAGIQLSIVYSNNVMTDMLIEYGASLEPTDSYYADYIVRKRVVQAKQTAQMQHMQEDEYDEEYEEGGEEEEKEGEEEDKEQEDEDTEDGEETWDDQ